MGPIGVPEMVAIFVIALLLFGPKKLPELGRTLGKAITEFRRASNELKSTFETHLNDLEKEVQLEKTPAYSSSSSPSTYPYPHDEYGQYNPDYNTPSSYEPASYEAPAGQLEAPAEHSHYASEPTHGADVHADYYASDAPVYSGSESHSHASEAVPEGSPSTTKASHSA